MMPHMPTSETAFAELAERHRRELHVHCYRMLGSLQEAEDLVQETLLRAWRARDALEREEWFRAWAYKIATNACLDKIRRDDRRVPSLGSFRDVPWLQPYPDRLLDEIAPVDEEPAEALVARETIELTFIAVIQLLPPRQRAVLILRDVLDWPARRSLLCEQTPALNDAIELAGKLAMFDPTGISQITTAVDIFLSGLSAALKANGDDHIATIHDFILPPKDGASADTRRREPQSGRTPRRRTRSTSKTSDYLSAPTWDAIGH